MFVAGSFDVVGLIRVAGEGAPELLEVDAAKWYIIAKNRIDLLKSIGHNKNLVVIATQRFRYIHKRTNGRESDGVFDLSRFKVRDGRIINFL